MFGAPLGRALRTGFYLAQAGEFAIVLLALAARSRDHRAGRSRRSCSRRWCCRCSRRRSMIQFAEPLARRFTASDWLARAARSRRSRARTMARQDHVIICGFGRSGQNLARLLERRRFRSSRSTPIRSASREAAGRRQQRGLRRRGPARDAHRGRTAEGARRGGHLRRHARPRSRSCTTCSSCGPSCR